MGSLVWRRRGSSIASLTTAVLLSLALASSTLAVTWGTARRLSSSTSAWATPRAIVATGTTAAVTAYEDLVNGTWGIHVRRSTDGGATWKPPILVSSGENAVYPSLAASGANVDVVWLEGSFDYRQGGALVMYSRSLDRGATWSSPRRLSALTTGIQGPGRPRVARAASGQVTVVWSQVYLGAVRVRTSLDGGQTWGSTKALGTSTSKPWYPDNFIEAFPVVAIGNDVTYVGYYTDSARLRVRRSIDAGANWLPNQTITTGGNGWLPDIAARGSTAVVGYAGYSSGDEWTVYRRTGDKGATWAAQAVLSPRTGYPSFQPTLAFRGGRWLATFERCLNQACDSSAVYLRVSTNGSSWGTTSRASSGASGTWAAAAGATYAGKILVLYDAVRTDDTSHVYVRPGTE